LPRAVGLRARAARGRRDRAPARESAAAVPLREPEAVDLLRPLGAAFLGKPLERAPPRLEPERGGTGGVGGETEHRIGERVRLSGRDEHPGLAVADEVLEAADRG